MRYDKVICWTINDVCNFNCEYCINHYRNKTVKPVEVDKFMKSLDDTNKTYKIVISGGEPFLVPNIVELSRAITERNYLVIVTNFILPSVIDFFNEVDRTNVTVVVSIHFDELQKKGLFDRFIRNYHYAVEKGFDLDPRIVAYPGYIENLDKKLKILDGNNVKYFFTSFTGNYKGKVYPDSYTEEEIKLFNLSEQDLTKYKTRGIPCPAGWKVMVADSRGDVYPCYEFMFSSNNITSNVFDNIVFPYEKPVLCPFDKCGCPFFVYEKSLMEEGDYKPVNCQIVDKQIFSIKLGDYLRERRKVLSENKKS